MKTTLDKNGAEKVSAVMEIAGQTLKDALVKTSFVCKYNIIIMLWRMLYYFMVQILFLLLFSHFSVSISFQFIMVARAFRAEIE